MNVLKRSCSIRQVALVITPIILVGVLINYRHWSLSHSSGSESKQRDIKGEIFTDKVVENFPNNVMRLTKPPQVISNEGRVVLEPEGGGFYQVSHEEVYLYSGFVDVRLPETTVRLFGLRAQEVTGNITCHYDLPSSSSRSKSYAIYPSWPSAKMRFLATGFECGIPPELVENADTRTRIDVSVSLGDSKTRTRMKIGVVGTTPYNERKTLVLCVKGIWGDVDHVKLIEWIEFNKYLGVEKIVFYDVLTLGQARGVLKHYEREGFVDIITFTYTQKMAIVMQNDPMKRKLRFDSMSMEQSFLVALNDCYYRYRDRFQYLLVLDIDEIIVPATNLSLVDLIKEANALYPKAAALLFHTAWHFNEYGAYTNVTTPVPDFLHMQRYLRRTAVMTKQPKAIIGTDRCLTINWHASVRNLVNTDAGNYMLPWLRFGFVHHYRYGCKFSPTECENFKKTMVVDAEVPRYRAIMSERVMKVMSGLTDL